MTDELRRHLADVFAEDDRQRAERAEHDDWMARRNGGAAPPMRESEPGALMVGRVVENARAGSPASEANGHGDPDAGVLFGDWRDSYLACVLGFVVGETRREMRDERDAELAKIRRAIADQSHDCRAALAETQVLFDEQYGQLCAEHRQQQSEIKKLRRELETRDRIVAALKAENLEVKRMLGEIEDAHKDFAARLENDRRDRDAVLAAYGERLGELRGQLKGMWLDSVS